MTTRTFDVRNEYYTIEHPDPARIICQGLYQYTGNGVGVAVVAVVNEQANIWTAYIGGTVDNPTEERTMLLAATHGAKLSQRDAQYYFPALACSSYWWRP